MRFLRDLGRRGLTGTDGPYGLIGDNDLGKLLRRKAGDAVSELFFENGVRADRIRVLPAARPRRRSGSESASNAACVRFNTVSLVSPKYCRRSLWPTKTHLAPTATSIGPEISPVNAPSFAQYRFCAPISTRVPLGRVAPRRQVDERRTNHDVAIIRLVDERAEILEEGRRLRDSLVHLPVTGH